VPEGTVEAAADQIFIGVKSGLSPEESARRVAQLVGPDTARAGMRLYRERANDVRTVRDPAAFINPEGLDEPWYTGPTDQDVFWPAYRDFLRDHRERSEEEIADVDQSSTRIVSLLPFPGTVAFSTRGLVMGSVQSGKTGNFTAVISKAADAGYRFFIVLSGMTDLLRDQTQGRLDVDALQHNPERWITLTHVGEDFATHGNVNSFLTGKAAHRTICVVKKNAPRLRRLLNWLEGARPEVLRNCPILIVDDEADQATVNAHQDPARRTEINRLVVRMLDILPKAAYVGYTATPYANLLTDTSEEDVYPRDFIVDLEVPDAYFGAERIFGREQFDWDEPDEMADGLDMIRIIPNAELPSLRPSGRKGKQTFVPAMTESLAEALRYFVLATAARRSRGHEGSHSTMLVHSSQFTSVHQGFLKPLGDEVDHLHNAVARNDATELSALRALWEREQAAVPSALLGQAPVSFDELRPYLGNVLDDIEVKAENAQSTERIDYDTPGRTYVVVGGNVLARGLTLEGLLVSHFVRSASAYDALLQMGRWFGYRRGYEDLPRVWMTKELRTAFYHLAGVEEDIRHQIGFYKHQHLTPLNLGIRIRTDPKLAITSRLKMRGAVRAQMSFSNKTPQTILFHHRDAEWLQANLATARSLVARIKALGLPEEPGRDPKYRVFRDVPANEVLQFVEEYRFHPEQVELEGRLVAGYIRDQNARDRLLSWNVVVVGRSAPGLGTIDLGLAEKSPLVNRSRFERGSDPTTADIKALISQNDIVADLDLGGTRLRELNSWEKMKAKRDELLGSNQPGVLLLYPISRNSMPEGKKRIPLDAVDDVLGIGFIFPNAGDDTPREYFTANLPEVDYDEFEFEDEDEA
jgi:hypothetical protein